LTPVPLGARKPLTLIAVFNAPSAASIAICQPRVTACDGGLCVCVDRRVTTTRGGGWRQRPPAICSLPPATPSPGDWRGVAWLGDKENTPRLAWRGVAAAMLIAALQPRADGAVVETFSQG
jgi:hypothetical protein